MSCRKISLSTDKRGVLLLICSIFIRQSAIFTVIFLQLYQLVYTHWVACGTKVVAALSDNGIDSLGWMERIPEDVLISDGAWLLHGKAVVTIAGSIVDHVIEEIVDVFINKDHAWEAGIKSVDEPNEAAVEHGNQLVDLLNAVVVTCQR
ncbi:hypothetical protein OWV82_020762 [Melia azedarach]|uniref:Uncharacterized protein n=1 Tax=Melia azedarach TaxID=155640 RepID=A0ACC1X6Z5_MELAZ|nr:hypothetical protein OWV82_020762 [Melia azedarach]